MRLLFDDIKHLIKTQVRQFLTNPYYKAGLVFSPLFTVLVLTCLFVLAKSDLVLLASPLVFLVCTYFSIGLCYVVEWLEPHMESLGNSIKTWAGVEEKDKNKPKREVDTSRLEHIPRENVDWHAEESTEGKNAHHK